MTNIKEIEGIGPAYGAKLESAGIATQEALLERACTRAGRSGLAEKTGITETMILEWVNRADLARIKGVGSEYADLLEAVGVDSVPEMANRNAANLCTKMAEINAAKHLVRHLPSESEVAHWIEHAKTLDRVVMH